MIKALCISSVFWVHCQLYYGVWTSSINQFIHTFYVNAFFFVSGYILFLKQISTPKINETAILYIRNGSGKLLLLNILYRIVIPSIIFSAIEFFPSSIIQGREIDCLFVLYKTIGGGTYWFTSALVVAELIMLLLFCTRKKNILFYTLICLFLGILGLTIVHFDILKSDIWACRQGLIALIFLAMGGLYWKLETQIDKLMRWWFVLPLLMIYVAIIVCFKDYNNPLISTLDIQPLGFVTSVIACILLVWLCKKLPENKTLTFIGQNSLGFYFMSGALPITLGIVANKIFSERSICIAIVIWGICLVIAYMAVKIINYSMPYLWDLRVIRKQDK